MSGSSFKQTISLFAVPLMLVAMSVFISATPADRAREPVSEIPPTSSAATSAPAAVPEIRAEYQPHYKTLLYYRSSPLPPDEAISASEDPSIIYVNEADAILLAKTVYGEAGGIASKAEQAAVAWCILNRVDATGYAMGVSIEYVITYPNQFLGYDDDNPVTEELYDLAADVLTRWQREKNGEADVGRVLPSAYMWFVGDGSHNYFRNAYDGQYAIWNWSLPSPYSAD